MEAMKCIFFDFSRESGHKYPLASFFAGSDVPPAHTEPRGSRRNLTRRGAEDVGRAARRDTLDEGFRPRPGRLPSNSYGPWEISLRPMTPR
jgi:hypothetical protein